MSKNVFQQISESIVYIIEETQKEVQKKVEQQVKNLYEIQQLQANMVKEENKVEVSEINNGGGLNG